MVAVEIVVVDFAEIEEEDNRQFHHCMHDDVLVVVLRQLDQDIEVATLKVDVLLVVVPWYRLHRDSYWDDNMPEEEVVACMAFVVEEEALDEAVVAVVEEVELGEAVVVFVGVVAKE